MAFITCPLWDKKGRSHEFSDELHKMLKFCHIPRSVTEIMTWLERKSRDKFLSAVLKPAIITGLISMTDPDKPKSKWQKYQTTPKDIEKLKQQLYRIHCLEIALFLINVLCMLPGCAKFNFWPALHGQL